MNIWILILGIFLGVSFISLLVFLFITVFREEESPTNENIIFNFMPQYSVPNPGYSVGLETETTKVNNRFLITYSPKDINTKRKEKVEDVKVVIDRNKVISLPAGTLSKDRTIKLLLPPKPEDFSTELKNTQFGQVLMELVQKINNENTVVDVLRNAETVKDKLLHKTDGMERVEEYLETDGELNKEMAKKAIERGSGTVERRPGGFGGSGVPPSYP